MTRLHSRREFLRYAGGTLALAALGGSLLSACNSATATPFSTPTLTKIFAEGINE